MGRGENVTAANNCLSRSVPEIYEHAAEMLGNNTNKQIRNQTKP